MSTRESIRSSVTVPQDVEPLLRWSMENDPRFTGQSIATVLAHFVREGLQAAYRRSLEAVEEMDADEFAPLVKGQRRAFAEAAETP